MNYLAHLYLARDSTESMIGSILGDFVKGGQKEQYPDKIKKGIELHRKIDSYTDAHPMSQASRRLYRPPWRRFGGIIVDLCYDHFLYRHWSTFTDTALTAFIQDAYGILKTHQAILPERLQSMIPLMIRNNWLDAYRDLSGVEQALKRLSRRVTNGDCLAGAIDEIKLHYRELESNFLNFFPDLIGFVNDIKSSHDLNFSAAGDSCSDSFKKTPQSMMTLISESA
ncbi:MAG: ACP phosphodiesterase [Desulfobacterales bacterium]|jgi:acyl carrier protein phosphodiesterase